MASELDVTAIATRLDRELVVAHLQDLLALHVAQDALNEQITSWSAHIERLDWEQNTNPTDPPEEPYPPQRGKPDREGLGCLTVMGCGGSLVAFLIVMVVVSSATGSYAWGAIAAAVVMVAVAAGLPLLVVLDAAKYVNDEYEKAWEEYSRRQAAYAEDLKQWQERRSSRLALIAKERPELAEQIKTGKRELDRVNAALDSAYAINIIPAPFRSTVAIYYLFDYLSTSRETMSSALLHANLEDIKRRLNQVILNQRKQMVQQAIDSARLANLSDAVGQTTNQVVRLGDRMGELIREATALRTSSEEAARHMENIEHYAQIGASHLASTRYWQQTMALDNYPHR